MEILLTLFVTIMITIIINGPLVFVVLITDSTMAAATAAVKARISVRDGKKELTFRSHLGLLGFEISGLA